VDARYYTFIPCVYTYILQMCNISRPYLALPLQRAFIPDTDFCHCHCSESELAFIEVFGTKVSIVGRCSPVYDVLDNFVLPLRSIHGCCKTWFSESLADGSLTRSRRMRSAAKSLMDPGGMTNSTPEILSYVSKLPSASNGGRPIRNSYISTPSDQTSTL
jgi:hypothetical protein